MKKLLLLLFLMLVSLGSYGEKVLYCSDNLATGFFKENGHWSSGNFTLKKWTIKFNQDYSLLSGLKGGRDWNCFNSYGNTDGKMVVHFHITKKINVIYTLVA